MVLLPTWLTLIGISTLTAVNARFIDGECIPCQPEVVLNISATPTPVVFPSYGPGYCDTKAPTKVPTKGPTKVPSKAPSRSPTRGPTTAPPPAMSPTRVPTRSPSRTPTRVPTKQPTRSPTMQPTKGPTRTPTRQPSRMPTRSPTKGPTRTPTRQPSRMPTRPPTRSPTKGPTRTPTRQPSRMPTRPPTRSPTKGPTRTPTRQPSRMPTRPPTRSPTKGPTRTPTRQPSRMPTRLPTRPPTKVPSRPPSRLPTLAPTVCVSRTLQQVGQHGNVTTAGPIVTLVNRTVDGTLVTFSISQEWKLTSLEWLAIEYQSNSGSVCDTRTQVATGPLPTPFVAKCSGGWSTVRVYARDDCFSSVAPYTAPATCGDLTSGRKVMTEFRLPCTPPCPNAPTAAPVKNPTRAPTRQPTRSPTRVPTRGPTRSPTRVPTRGPTRQPTRGPTRVPTRRPTRSPTRQPSRTPSRSPTRTPTRQPSRMPTSMPTRIPTRSPTRIPTRQPSRMPTSMPTRSPTRQPTRSPTRAPTRSPTRQPSRRPTSRPTFAPTVCVPRALQQVSQHGNVTPAGPILSIVNRTLDGTYVTFSISQEWKLTMLEWLTIEYQGNSGSVCDAKTQVLSGPLAPPYTAKCTGGWTTVKVYARDDCFSSIAPYTTPALCGTVATGRNVMTEFRVPCTPPCPTTQSVPTRSPTRAPTHPPQVCIRGVTLHNRTSSTRGYTVPPIKIISKDTNTVSIQIVQAFKTTDSISWVATQFMNAGTNTTVCPKKNTISPNAVVDYSTGSCTANYPTTLTVRCVNGIANVNIFAHDGSFSSEPTTKFVPDMCQPSTDDGKKIGFYFNVPCVNCPGQSPTVTPPI